MCVQFFFFQLGTRRIQWNRLMTFYHVSCVEFVKIKIKINQHEVVGNLCSWLYVLLQRVMSEVTKENSLKVFFIIFHCHWNGRENNIFLSNVCVCVWTHNDRCVYLYIFSGISFIRAYILIHGGVIWSKIMGSSNLKFFFFFFVI